MSDDPVCEHEPVWPEPKQEHLQQVFEQSCRAVRGPEHTRRCRPPLVSWDHLCLAIMHGLLRGWNVQVDVWRLICSEQVGACAPVHVTDHAISNRIEQAVPVVQALFREVSA